MGFFCGCEDGRAEVWRESTHRARKQYRCTECRQPIKPGDTYVRIFAVHDGEASTYFNCERCNDLIAAFLDLDYCWYIGEFLEAYADWLADEGKRRPKWLEDLYREGSET